jgi:sugar phosphate isomerase/epimerase
MKLGLVVDPRLGHDWEGALDLAARVGVTHVEPCGGGHVPKGYVDPGALDADDAKLEAFRASIADRGLAISALGCYGNPVHPDRARAEAAHEDFVRLCSVAEKLGVTRITHISGVPAAGPQDRVPNWIVPSIYADLEKAYQWQWEEVLIPYWREACSVAARHGVSVCIEPIGGFMVYNGQTFLRLREACGETLKVNFDPSHFWWMGIDPLLLIEQLRGMIGHAHAKDVGINPRTVARDGIVPACRYDDWDNRSWVYRAIGWGHDESFWRDFVTTLRRNGYDDVVAIEIEDAYMTMDEAVEKSVELVSRCLPREPVPEGNFFDAYEWESAEVD